MKRTRGLTDQIRAALEGGVAKTSAELHDACDLSMNTTQVAGALNRMFVAGVLARTTNADNRFIYTLKAGSKKLQTADADAEADAVTETRQMTQHPELQVKPTVDGKESAPAPAAVEKVEVSTVPVAARKRFYSLFDHIAATLKDLDDLAGDAIDNNAKPEILKFVLASQGALRRAQESIYRETRTWS